MLQIYEINVKITRKQRKIYRMKEKDSDSIQTKSFVDANRKKIASPVRG